MKKAFTLAETLITISIIGIVAAITLPTLISKYQKNVLVNQLKSSYSILARGIKNIYVGEGVDDIADLMLFTEYAYEQPTLTRNTLAKYFKIIRNFEYGSNGEYVYRNWVDYKNIKLSNSFILINGAIVYIYDKTVYVDVNGYKGPSELARDLFEFSVNADGSLTPVDNIGSCHYVDDYTRLKQRVRDGEHGYINVFEQVKVCDGPSYGAKRIMDDGWKMNY